MSVIRIYRQEDHMKVDEALVDVIDLCTKIDGKSAAIYNNFSRNSRDETIRKMWKEMSGEEREHAEGWQRLLAFVKEGSAFYVFDEPVEIRNELQSILSRVDTFLEKSKDLTDISSAFVIACNLELFMLHRSFISLFYYLQTVSSCDHNFGKNYGEHLSNFISVLNKYGLSPELEVLGEAIQRLWKDNNDLVIQSNRDFLTGVFNRRGFFQAAIPLAFMAQREGNNVGVMMIDGVDFKKVNDNYGHQAGDEVLKLIANSIKNHVRRSDLVGRYGGRSLSSFYPTSSQIISSKLLIRSGKRLNRRAAPACP